MTFRDPTLEPIGDPVDRLGEIRELPLDSFEALRQLDEPSWILRRSGSFTARLRGGRPQGGPPSGGSIRGTTQIDQDLLKALSSG